MGSNKEIAERMKWLRKEHLKLTQEQVATRLGDITRGAVGNWERGEGIKRANVLRFSETFGVSFDWLVTGRGKPFDNVSETLALKVAGTTSGSIPVHGTVAAGVWQEAFELDISKSNETLPASVDYPPECQIALLVSGESLNKIAKDGDHLVCLDLYKSGVQVSDGDLVVVERSRMGGMMIERTAKRLRKTLHGYELWPESTHPDFQTPIEYKPDGDEDHNEVRVIAKVLWVMKKP